MRIDLLPILEAARSLLAAVEAKDGRSAFGYSAVLLAKLPPDDFCETAPGVAIYGSAAEWSFAGMLPFLNGAARKWHGWLSPDPEPDIDADWPAPANLRRCCAALEDVARQCGISLDEPALSEAM